MLTHNPRVRGDLLVSEVGSELVVYDTATHQAHSLSETAAQVWRLTDGTRTLEDIVVAATQLHLDEASVFRALDEFAKLGLLQKDESLAGISRRAMLGKVAAGAALPLVISVLAPTPADASSAGFKKKGNNGSGQEKKGKDDGLPPGFIKKKKPEKDPSGDRPKKK